MDTNFNPVKVSGGMIGVVDALNDNYTAAERQAVIVCLFSSLYEQKLKSSRGLGELMDIVNRVREDCKIKKIPEFGGAERYISNEL